MMSSQNEIIEDNWKEFLSIFQLVAERGRRIRQAQLAATAENAPLAGDISTVADQPPAESTDSV